MRRLTRTLTLIFALFTFAAVIPNAQAAEIKQDMSNIIRYIPEEDWNNSQLNDAEKQSKAHTIHWLTGIKPPRMPHEITEIPGRADDSKVGDFTFIKDSGTAYYASPYYPGNGWYDINKYVSESGSGMDSHTCFAVAMTDMLHWWLDQNRDYVEDYVNQLPSDQQTKKNALTNYLDNSLEGKPNEPVLQDPRTSRLYNDVIFPLYNGADKGGWPDKPADYFFNGYPSDKDKMARNRPEDFPKDGPTSGGGLFYDVFGKSILTDHIGNGHYSALNDNLKNYMDQGIGVVIGFNMMGGSHAIAMWGAEYDETGNLCALYMVDNNDNGTSGIGATINGELIAMIRYDVYKSPNGPAAYITTRVDKTGNNIVNSYYPLTLARDGWEYWKNSDPHRPKYEKDGRAFLNPIKDTVQCDHEYSYAAMGAQLIQSCPKCGDTIYIYMDFSSTTERVYNDNKPVKPVVKKSSLGNAYPFLTSDIWYKNNYEVGTATAYMSTTQDDVKYTAKLDFEILPKPMNPPVAAPEQEAVGPYSILVKTEPGLEYSIDGQEWWADGKFYGLTPNTAYEVQVRTAAPADNKNYTHSEPFSRPLQVKTEDGAALGDPSWRITALENNQVTVQNSGTYATVKLVIAGYDTRGRQNFVEIKEVTGGADQPVTVSFSGGSAEYRAFLLDEKMRPVTDRKALTVSAAR